MERYNINILFRADSSMVIGTGHIMRCLTLAGKLNEKGAKVTFISREAEGDIIDIIERKGFGVYRLPKQTKVTWEEDVKQTLEIIKNEEGEIDWFVIDHYDIDIKWETEIRKYTKKIMVIDDLANRKHDCDLLLDQNLSKNIETRYDELVPDECTKLLGPSYALLRDEFLEARKNIRKRDGNVKRILVFFGGSDPTNETEKSLKALKMLNRNNITIDVVVGKSNANQEKIREICSLMKNTNYYCQVDNMAFLMAKADLAIGAGGATTWERIYLGLPSITIVVADNQKELTEILSEKKIVINLGNSSSLTINDIRDAFNSLINQPGSLREMSRRAFNIVGESNILVKNITQMIFGG